MRSNAYCGNLLWQSSLTLQAPVGRLRVAEGARLVVTDPEKLSAYRDRDKTAFLTSTAKLEGPVPTLALDTATFGRWVCRKSADGKSLRFGPANGTLLVVR